MPEATIAVERQVLACDLQLALERGELVPYYQPKVDLATGVVAGMEALIRWQHPERGLVTPGQFMPLAEETGLCVSIGRMILTEACRQLVAWQARYPTLTAPMVAVNVSDRQFQRPDLVAVVATTLAETGLNPALLKLEIPETAAMAQPAEGAAILHALRTLGVRLAIDDYGLGYSPLAALPLMPINTLKLDPLFLQPGDTNRAIVRAIAVLAEGLGLDVTAEGLETAEQVLWAREVGCTLGQGYYFAPSLPAEEFEALWETGLRFALPANFLYASAG